MRIARYTDPHFADASVGLYRRPEPRPEVRRIVYRILAEVRRGGDEALLRLSERFGGPPRDAVPLRVGSEEFAAAAQTLDARTEHAMAEAHENVRAFALKSLRHDWTMHQAGRGR